MFSKSIIAVLIVASAAVALSTKAIAGPRDEQPRPGEAYYEFRASQNYDGAAGN
jgi:hypothetical protein